MRRIVGWHRLDRTHAGAQDGRRSYRNGIDVNRRDFIATLAATSAGLAERALAQKAPRVPTIGILSGFRSGLGIVGPGGKAGSSLAEAFRALGYADGANINFIARAAEGRIDRLAELAAELVRLRCDVLITNGSEAAAAAKQATASIPIVFLGPSYPVEEGLVASLARPGANVTGFTLAQSDHVAKHLQLLRELVPTLAHVAVLWSPDNRGTTFFLRDAQVAAAALGLKTQSIALRSAADVAPAIASLRSGRPGAALVNAFPAVIESAQQIGEAASQLRVATITSVPILAERGLLLSYGADPREFEPRIAHYVDRILRGARPADLPVQQPTKLALVVNLRTARAMGMTVSQGLLQRADRVIE